MAQTKQIGHNMGDKIIVSHSQNGWLAVDSKGNKGVATFKERAAVAIDRCKEAQGVETVEPVKEARQHKAKIATKYDTFEVKRY